MVDKDMLEKGIGSYIKTRREELHLTQQQLNDLSNVSIQHISGIERGIRTPGLLHLVNIMKALDIEPNDLFQPYIKQVKTDPEQYEKFCELGKNIDEEAMDHILYMLEKVQSK